MYGELVKRLREDAEWAEANEWETPITLSDNLKQGADAIEELSRAADAIPHVCECCIGCELEKKNGGCNHAFVLSPKRAKEYLSKPRWIPVTERLPESQGPFLARYGFGDVSKETKQFFYGVMYYFYADADPHWQHESTGIEVTHWMPLPEPPKEET